MKSREETLTALKKGKTLFSKSTKLYYKNIDGKLHRSYINTKYANWVLSDLQFKEKESWKNMSVVKG